MKRNILNVAMATMLLSLGLPLTADAALMPEQGAEQAVLMPKKKTSKKKKTTTTKKKSSNVKSSASKKSAAVVEDNTVEGNVDASASQQSTTGQVLGGLLGGILGGNSSSSSKSQESTTSDGSSVLGGLLGGAASSLSTIFDSSKTASADQLVGTWTYSEPAVVFESSNVLKNLGGKVASATIEKQLNTQFSKLGIKKGAMKMTFDKDGNFTQTIGGKTLTGTYTVSGKQVKLSYGGQVQQLLGSTQLDGKNLIIAVEAGKLLKYADVIGKLTGNSLVSTLGSLLSGYDGMEIGFKLEK